MGLASGILLEAETISRVGLLVCLPSQAIGPEFKEHQEGLPEIQVPPFQLNAKSLN